MVLMSVDQFRKELGPDETGRMVDISTLRKMIVDGCFPFAKASTDNYKKRYIISREGFEAWKFGGAPVTVLRPMFDYMARCQEDNASPSWEGLRDYIVGQASA